MGDLRKRIRRIAQDLRRDYATEIDADARGFKKRVARLLKLSLPPFPGRPTEPAVTEAIKLRKQGKEWKHIYPQAIPDHAVLDPIQKRYSEANLRAAVRSRQNAARRRERERSQPPNALPDDPLLHRDMRSLACSGPHSDI